MNLLKILVLSDSHASLSFMRLCVKTTRPDHVVHLGDHYDDAQALAEENPHIRFHAVPGNCDRFRCDPTLPQTLCYCVGGVKFYMTHGHLHGVKSGIGALLQDARRQMCAAALYGHTHKAYCEQLEDGLWVMNPGTCGTYGGSAGIIEIADERISACYLVQQADLDKMEGLCQN